MAKRAEQLGHAWLRAHPLLMASPDADKNSRGRVFCIGGCATVPGGIRLTAEAALRAGAGKVQIATVQSVSVGLGIALPETAIFAMPETGAGEISARGMKRLAKLIESSDALVLGPAMSDGRAAGRMLDKVASERDKAVVLDAAVFMTLNSRASLLRAMEVAPVLTPHIGEMAAMLERSVDEIEVDRAKAVKEAARHYGAVCVLKGAATFIADPSGAILTYPGGGVGLATGGSGDVMAGVIAGLRARGASPFEAAGWGVWIHGEAGQRCAVNIGPIGFVARELIAEIPGILHGAQQIDAP